MRVVFGCKVDDLRSLRTHLAKPPPGGAAVDECTEYLDNIAALTDSLPLTMLCGTGVGESVITTAI